MRLIIILSILTLFFFTISCGVKSDITSPEIKTENDSGISGQHFLWGYYSIGIDPVNASAEIIPLRDAEFHANVVTFLQAPSPLGLAVVVEDVSNYMTKGEIDVTVSITHPFSIATYTGFDVKGIFIAPGSKSSQVNSSIVYANPNEARLLNADGFTRWWNPKEFGAPGLFGFTTGVLGTPPTGFNTTLNSFKYFADHLESTDDFYLPAGNRNVFSAASTNSRLYKLRFPIVGGAPKLVFNYAVDASWKEPIGNPSDINNFPPDANMLEPYLVKLNDNGSSAYYDELSGLFGGELNLTLEIRRHGGAENLSWVYDEIQSIKIESDTIFNDIINIDPSTPDLIDGDAVYYNLNIDNLTPTSSKDQDILVHVETNATNYSQGFGAPSPSGNVSAYLIAQAPVIDGFWTPDPPAITKIETIRSVNGKLQGFTVEWADSDAAEEYVVYVTDDPYENNGPMQFTASNDSPVSNTSWTKNIVTSEVNGQWGIKIAARSVAGQPGSEGEPGVMALVDFAGFDAYAEGQNEWRKRHNVLRNKFIQTTALPLGIENSPAVILSPQHAFYRNACAYLVSPPLPTISGWTNASIEFGHNRKVNFPSQTGYSVCSTPTIQDPQVIAQDLYDNINWPGQPQMVIYDYNIDLVHETDYVDGNPMNESGLLGLKECFNKSTTESSDPYAGWGGLATSGFEISHYAIPKIITENHKYAGIAYAGENGTTAPATNPIIPNQYPLIIDEVALIIF